VIFTVFYANELALQFESNLFGKSWKFLQKYNDFAVSSINTVEFYIRINCNCIKFNIKAILIVENLAVTCLNILIYLEKKTFCEVIYLENCH
jgi:hypothetical protein